MFDRRCCGHGRRSAARLVRTLGERGQPVRFLIRDHDRTFTDTFDAVFESEGVRVVRTPIQVPEANGIAERFVRTARSECLDWLLIMNARHLQRTLAAFVAHYNGIGLTGVWALNRQNGRLAATPCTAPGPISVKHRDRLGGLLHEYPREV